MSTESFIINLLKTTNTWQHQDSGCLNPVRAFIHYAIVIWDGERYYIRIVQYKDFNHFTLEKNGYYDNFINTELIRQTVDKVVKNFGMNIPD